MAIVEIYVLCEERTENHLSAFLNYFLPERLPSMDEYSIPENSDDPQETYFSEKEILARLFQKTNEPYAFYWNGDAPISTVMVFFTNDNGLIVGLAIDDHEKNYYQKMISLVNGQCGYIQDEVNESPPPDSTEEFRQLANAHKYKDSP